MAELTPRPLPDAAMARTGTSRLTTVFWISDTNSRSDCHLYLASNRGAFAPCGAKIDHATAATVAYERTAVVDCPKCLEILAKHFPVS